MLREEATDRPSGAYFLFELLWRGVSYGAIDALLLTAFPCAVVYRLMRSPPSGLGGRLRFAVLALPLIVLITAVYHLGYPQYRDDGVRQPETGNILISTPALATVNPLGSVLAHVSMHVAAVAHSYETPTFLPPETES